MSRIAPERSTVFDDEVDDNNNSAAVFLARWGVGTVRLASLRRGRRLNYHLAKQHAVLATAKPKV